MRLNAFLLGAVFCVASVLASCQPGKSDPPSGNGRGGCVAGNGSFIPGGCSATPSPPPTHIKTWSYYHQYSENMATTSTQANNWLSYCEGGPTAVSDCSNSPARSILYVNISEAYIKNTGSSTDMPWHQSLVSTNGGTCPNTGSTSWQTNADETWYEHAAGTSNVASNRIAALATTSTANDTYVWFLNRGSTTLQSYIQNVLDFCTQTDGTTKIDNYYGLFADNTEYQMTAGGADFGLWGSTINIGSGSGGPYGSGSCGTLYGGTTCTISSKIAASRLATLECATDLCYEQNGIVSLFQSLLHAASGSFSGATWDIYYNGYQNTDVTPLQASNVRAGAFENDIVSAGSILSDSNIESVVDAGATYAASSPSKGIMILNTDSGTSAQNAIGTQGHQRELRLVHGVEWLVFNDNLVDWSNLEDNQASGNAVSAWPIDFLYPTQPVQTAGAATPANCGFNATGGSCTGGGAHDSAICVYGSAPNCVFRREFAHCYWQPNYTWSASGQIDAGACGVLVNLTGSSQTISSSWLSQWASYNHAIAMCTPNASYWTNPASTTSVCTTTTSAGDVGGSGVGTGPGVLDFTTAKNTPTSLPDRDAIFYTAQ